MKNREAELDLLVGQNIRFQRMAAGISQRELGTRIGITFQQIQKVEQGKIELELGVLPWSQRF